MINVIENLEEYQKLKDKDYLKIFLRSVPIDIQEEMHNKYIEENLFNSEEIGENGVIGFLTAYSAKKIFTQHKTSSTIKGISSRFSRQDAIILNTFEKMWKRKCFPNPLPIIVDKREINKEVVKIYNEASEPLHYKELIRTLFDSTKEKSLSNYYLLNYRNTKDGMVLNDFDFVPLFRYKYDSALIIENVTELGIVKDKLFEKEPNDRIDNVFDFERIVVREIFNNSLVKIKEDRYLTNYFEDIDPKYVSGGDMMFLLIMKYRKAFYDYIYKSKTNAIDTLMFDDIMYNSILSNIQKDDIKGRFEWNNSIKRKTNIWFSLYNIFNNNKNTVIMASKVTDLMSKMRSVVKGDSILETPEEFAFGAGQIVSYLIDRSVASNKTYALLEPYLQKMKSNFLQDSISQSIATYKHDISTYKGTFQALASNVLTFDENVDMKPLLKYFLAGCFCSCVIYDKKQSDNN